MAIFGSQMHLAHRALGEAADAALSISESDGPRPPADCDYQHFEQPQRSLAPRGEGGPEPPRVRRQLPKHCPRRPRSIGNTLISRAELEWSRAPPTWRIGFITRRIMRRCSIAWSRASPIGSQTIVNEFPTLKLRRMIRREPPGDPPKVHPLDSRADQAAGQGLRSGDDDQTSGPGVIERLVAAATSASMRGSTRVPSRSPE